ncbi:MAG: alpha/beta fold hydrolase [Myxococcales bacterium]|nr:alpha/beta fold hydrolase [Myxococcales bacterium]
MSSHDRNSLPAALHTPSMCPVGAQAIAHRGSRVGVLVLHGFTGSPWEVQPLCEAAMDRGLSVAAPILPGHATTIHALDQVQWQDWLVAAQLSHAWLARNCDVVHLAGFSMGGLLAALLAEQHPTPDRRLALLAPAFAVSLPQKWILQVLARVGVVSHLGKADPRLPSGLRPPCYAAIPIRGAQQFLQLMSLVTSKRRVIGGEILHLHGTSDGTIDRQLARTAVSKAIEGKVRNADIDSGHLLFQDRNAQQALKLTMDFLTDV